MSERVRGLLEAKTHKWDGKEICVDWVSVAVDEQFSDEEIVELVFACAIFNWGNKFNITMQMNADEESEYTKDMAYRQEALT